MLFSSIARRKTHKQPRSQSPIVGSPVVMPSTFPLSTPHSADPNAKTACKSQSSTTPTEHRRRRSPLPTQNPVLVPYASRLLSILVKTSPCLEKPSPKSGILKTDAKQASASSGGRSFSEASLRSADSPASLSPRKVKRCRGISFVRYAVGNSHPDLRFTLPQ